MKEIPLQALPAQTFSVPLDNNVWDISIKLTAGAISCSFILNGTKVIDNIRAVAGYRLIPYDYLQDGNFAFITMNFEVPDYTKFGTTQKLVYISQAELDGMTPPFKGPRITLADFDPNGAIPLRFQPKGYVQV